MEDVAQIGITAFCTLLVGLIGALVGSRIQARRERATWLREKRFAVCRAYLVSHDWSDLNQKVGAVPREDLPPPADYYAEFDLLGLERVSAMASDLDRSLRPLEAMARKEVPFDADRYERLQEEHDLKRAAWTAEVRRILGTEML